MFKNIQKTLTLALLLCATMLLAQVNNIVTETAMVKGNCGMCKATIEKAANRDHVINATWDKDKKILHFTYDGEKTSKEEILKRVADVGYENELFPASEEAYNNLPMCCLYKENPDEETHHENMEENMNHKKEHPHESNDNDEHNREKTEKIDEVTIFKTAEATSLHKKEAALTYKINSKELLKAACCNLSESFETNATVDVSFNNAVTGTKQLKMLGLDQKYTALTKELLPEIRGLATAYGLNFIPGRWINSIQLTKGGSTVVNGYESITGQINTELVKFNKKPETSINLFTDGNTRTELNITTTSSLSEHWSQSVLIHGNATITERDSNNDGFLDQPIGHQLNTTYILNYNDIEHKGWASNFGVNLLKDSRKAGQKGYDWEKPQNKQSLYGVGIDIDRFQIWNKTGFVFLEKPYQSFGWMNQFTHHQQDSFFGNKNYWGKENTFYSNLIFESIIGNTNHKYKVGASFLYDYFDEKYLDESFERTETVPGLFAEYTLTGDKLTLVAGLRSDFHNLAGTQISPRLNFKYDLFHKTILRLSTGRGFRTANLFAESQQFLASNRVIEIKNNNGEIYGLKPEIAWNYGASIQQEFKLFNRKASLVADVFRTDFQSHVLTDLDTSTHKIIFYNLEGKSSANAIQMQLEFTPIKNLDIRMAYKFYDVWADYATGRRKIPFVAKHRGFLNASYTTNKNQKKGFWNFDTTLQYVGQQRLPITSQNQTPYQLASYSDAYFLLNAQISKNFNDKIRLYLGAENLTSYTQKNPIVDVKNPFGNYFDSGMVYAPIMPTNVYLGLDVSF